MTQSENISPELRRLVNLMCDAQLSPEEHARLEEILLNDASAREFYRECMALHGELAWSELARRSMPQSSPLSTPCCPTSHDSPIMDFLGAGLQHVTGFFSRSFVLTILLAIGLPVIILYLLLVDISRQPVAVAPDSTHTTLTPKTSKTVPVAIITKSHQAVWEGGDKDYATGTYLLSDQKVHLASGLAEITFFDGARVLLEGPATFDTNSSSLGFLHEGKLVAKVPKGAEGFTVATPSATVIDLGTEFGLSVAQNGMTETCVFQGTVNVSIESALNNQNNQKKKKHLEVNEGHAVRVVTTDNGPLASRIEPIAVVTSAQFVRNISDSLPQPTIIFAHYGDTDPATEGWNLHKSTGARGNKTIKVGPIDEDGTKAWSISSPGSYYSIYKEKGLTSELLEEAKEKGWVLRTRVWVNPTLPPPVNSDKGLFLCSYRDDDSVGGGVRILLDREGNQMLQLQDKSTGIDETISIPESRDRYVDYELRCHPNEKRLEMYANGRCVHRGRPNKDIGTYATIRFGMDRPTPSDIRCARVEWGVLRDTSSQ